MLNNVLIFKPDDTVAHNVNDQKVTEIGLVYEDILMYWQLLPRKDTTQKSYKEKKEEFTKKLKRTHNVGKNKEKQQVSYKITFGLKRYEKKGCICERNEHFTSDCYRNALYSELHQKAREYYNILESSETYLATFYDKKIETGSKDLGTYALAQKEEKREFNYIYYIQLYLLYSRTASNEKRL